MQLACRHLDLDGDGYISVEEVEALLAELGVPQPLSEQTNTAELAIHQPLSEQTSTSEQGLPQPLLQQPHVAGLQSGQSQASSSGPSSMSTLSNHKITFTQFLQLHRQVCVHVPLVNPELLLLFYDSTCA